MSDPRPGKRERPRVGGPRGAVTANVVKCHLYHTGSHRCTQSPRVIYLTTPADQYLNPLYPAVLATIRKRFPRADLRQSARPFPDGAGWQQWREEVDLLIVWARNDRTLDARCCQEVEDAQSRSIPVYALSRDGCLFLLDCLEPVEPGPMDRGNWRRFVRVVRGKAV